MSTGHSCLWVNNANDLDGGDLCFYLSYSQIVSQESLAKFRNNLVVHASDLPKGREVVSNKLDDFEGKNQNTCHVNRSASPGGLRAYLRSGLDGPRTS